MRTTTRRAIALGFTAVLATGLSACVQDTSKSSSGSSSSSSGGSSASGKIGLLLPESKTTRYESFDKPYFEAKAKELCPSCQVVYANADQDAAKQQQQAESMLTQGIKVMVLDPVDSDAAKTIVNSAKNQNVPVVSYDRFVKDSPINVYISFDNEKVGQLQGQTLVAGLKAAGKTSGDLVMINGSPTDNNATLFKKGAHSVLDTSGYKIKAEYDTPDWSPDKAQAWMDGQLANVKTSLVGVYAANDGTAGGAIAAMKAGGVKPLPLVTGQDAELAAIQRILAGDQYMTVYKAIKPEAEGAAALAVALLKGEKPANATAQVNGIPSVLLQPVAVTKSNVQDTVIKDGFYKAADVCTAQYAQACAANGVK